MVRRLRFLGVPAILPESSLFGTFDTVAGAFSSTSNSCATLDSPFLMLKMQQHRIATAPWRAAGLNVNKGRRIAGNGDLRTLSKRLHWETRRNVGVKFFSLCIGT